MIKNFYVILIGLILLTAACACDDSSDGGSGGSSAIPFIPSGNDGDFGDDDAETTTTTTEPDPTTTTTTTSTTVENTTTTAPIATTTTSVTTTTHAPIPTIPDSETQLVAGGRPGQVGTALALRSGGGLYIASEKEGRLVVYSVIGDDVVEENIDYVDSAPSLAVDAAGRLHAAYYNPETNCLMHAVKESGNWTVEVADGTGAVGWRPSLVLDAAGNAHISYYEIFNANLKYATNSGGSWGTQVVESQGDAGSYSSIGVDPTGNAHIAYFDAGGGDLKYATNESGNWISRILDENAGPYSSLAVDSAGNILIGYQGYILEGVSCLKIADNCSGAWTTQVIDAAGQTGAYASLALDAADAAHISYYGEDDGNLKYAQNAYGSWATQNVDTAGDVGRFCALALNDAGQAYISYFDLGVEAVKYATNSAGNWSIAPVDWVAETGMHPDMTQDAGGGVHLSFIDGRSDRIRYASNESGLWETQNVDELDEDFSDDWTTRLAVDSSGKAHILFADSGAVQYATNAFGPWVVQNLDGGAVLPELAMDAADNLHAAYAQNGRTLVYAMNDGGGWTAQTLHDSFDEIYDTAMAVEQNGHAHIIFTGSGDAGRAVETIYATNSSGDWIFNPLNDIAENIALSVGDDGFAHVTYIENGYSGQLKYATNESGAWVEDFVITTGNLPGFHAQALDAAGLVHVVYLCGSQEAGYCGMRYAAQSEGAWPRYEIFPGAALPHADIAVDGGGNILVVYFQDGGLRLTTFAPLD